MNSNKIIKFLASIALFAFVFLAISYFFCEIGFARPGGGSGFSGGGGGGGFSGGGGGGYSGGGGFSGGGGGGGEGGGLLALFIMPIIFIVNIMSAIYSRKRRRVAKIIGNSVFFTVSLVLELAMLGGGFTSITFFIVVVIVVVRIVMQSRKNVAKSTYKVGPSFTYRYQTVQHIDKEIEKLKVVDPNFSKVLFLDFIASLFHKYYHYQGTDALNNLLPFMPKANIDKAKLNRNQKFKEIIIGSLEIRDIYQEAGKDMVIISMETNYTMTRTDINKDFRYVSTVRWLIGRDATTKSKEPEHFDELECPNCASPADFTDVGQCKNCQTIIETGKMQWAVEQMHVMRTSHHQVPNLVYYAPEKGTNYPTVMQPNINAHMEKLVAEHNYGSVSEFWGHFTEDVVKPIFTAIYDAWEKHTWMDVRHVVSDRLWESYNNWVEAYKAQRLYNRLKHLEISKVALARVDIDKFYESITVRIYASCYDFVENEQGQLRGGNNKISRKFTEYWTFIRRKGLDDKKIDLHHCPNCGAAKDKMGQAGICGYCGTKVTSGNFSWVLAIITQDEVYQG